jgi:hypothetical protein
VVFYLFVRDSRSSFLRLTFNVERITTLRAGCSKRLSNKAAGEKYTGGVPSGVR